MPTAAQLREALKKAGANDSMIVRTESMAKTIDEILVPEQPGFQASIPIKGQQNSICLTVKILNIEEKDTKPKTGPPGKMCNVLVLVLDQGKDSIKADVGRRDDKGRIYVKILGEQRMTVEQQKEYAEKKAASRRTTGAARKNHIFKFGETPVLEIMRFQIFEPTPVNQVTNTKFKKGDIVLICGPQPKQQFKENSDLGVHDPDFGVKWSFGSMAADPRENDPNAPPRKSGDWAFMMENNHTVNFSKAPPPDGGWSLDNMSDEDKALIEKWTAEGTLDANRFDVGKFGLKPEDREALDRLLIMPLGQNAKADQPFYQVRRRFVKFSGVFFGSTWVEEFKGVGNVDQKAAKADLQCIAQVIERISTTETRVRNVMIQVEISGRNDPDGVNQYGIVKLGRWENLAPQILPHVSGFLVAKLATAQSEMLPANQPMLNPRKSNGEMAMGVDFAVQYYQFYHAPELASLILSQTAFQINLACVKVLMRAALGFEDPSTASIADEYRNNPLNSGNRNVINMFETTERPDNLEQNYDFFLIYATDESAYTSISSTREDLAAAKLDEVATWSAIFSASPKIKDPAKELFKLNSLPKPDFSKPSNSDKYCVFAVRKTEVARVRAGLPEMPLDAFAKRMIEIDNEETAKFGPLPEGPASADQTEKRGASVENTPKKPAGAKKSGRKGRGASASVNPPADNGEGAASQADADFFGE